jgi:hypothetical protein
LHGCTRIWGRKKGSPSLLAGERSDQAVVVVEAERTLGRRQLARGQLAHLALAVDAGVVLRRDGVAEGGDGVAVAHAATAIR